VFTTLSQAISLADFSSQPNRQSRARVVMIGVEIKPASANGSDPSPLAHQSGVIEQCLLDRKNVIPGHVTRAVDTIENKQLILFGSLIGVAGDEEGTGGG
jgi:hypothetical protein